MCAGQGRREIERSLCVCVGVEEWREERMKDRERETSVSLLCLRVKSVCVCEVCLRTF